VHYIVYIYNIVYYSALNFVRFFWTTMYIHKHIYYLDNKS